MSSLIFVIKSFVITVFVILMLQIKIGEHTIEYRLDDMVRKSGIEQPAQYLADGIVRLVRNTWRTFSGQFNENIGNKLKGSSAPGARSLGIDLNRSAEYIKEQAQKAKTEVEAQLQQEEAVTDRQ